MLKNIKRKRLSNLPDAWRRDLIRARRKRGWSQAELGRRAGLPQVHISKIETGKVIPRSDTLIDLVRILDYDLELVPRPLVPTVQSLIRDYQQPGRTEEDEVERPVYATDEEPETTE